MGRDVDTTTLFILLANIGFSIWGFSDRSVIERFKFRVADIKRGEYYRLITSGFLHVNSTHLIVNMLTLYFFGPGLVRLMGPVLFLIIYFGAMLGGDLLALFVHRNHPTYSAVGASGAISGLIFAFVIFLPTSLIYLFFIIPVPAFLYAILYVLYSLYGVKSQQGNIGHEAHLGGAVLGMLIAFFSIPILFDPIQITMVSRLWILAALLVPIIIVFYILETRPELLNISGGNFRKQGRFKIVRGQTQNTRDRHYNPRREMQKEMDTLLDKVGTKGIGSLSKKEKDRLEELSKYFQEND